MGASNLHDGDGHCIAKQHLNGRGGDRCKIKGAQLSLEGQGDHTVTDLVQLAPSNGSDAHQVGALGLQRGI